MHVNATYSKEDKLGIDLFRNRYGLVGTELEPRSLRAMRPNFSDTVEGLASFGSEDILRLRNSEALRTYEIKLLALAEGSASYEDALSAFTAFREEVSRAIFEILKKKPNSGSQVLEEYSCNNLGSWLRFVVRGGIEAGIDLGIHLATGVAVPVGTFIISGYERVMETFDRGEVRKALSRGMQIERQTANQHDTHLEMLLQGREGMIVGEVTLDQGGLRDLSSDISDRPGSPNPSIPSSSSAEERRYPGSESVH